MGFILQVYRLPRSISFLKHAFTENQSNIKMNIQEILSTEFHIPQEAAQTNSIACLWGIEVFERIKVTSIRAFFKATAVENYSAQYFIQILMTSVRKQTNEINHRESFTTQMCFNKMTARTLPFKMPFKIINHQKGFQILTNVFKSSLLFIYISYIYIIVHPSI